MVQHVFEYIRMLKEAKVQEWIFKELQQVDRNDFRFKEKENPYDYVSRLGHHLHHYPPEHCVAGPYLLEEFDPVLIENLLGLLNPYNFRFTWCSPCVENLVLTIDFRYHVIKKDNAAIADTKEQWYGTEFKRETIPTELLAKVKSSSQFLRFGARIQEVLTWWCQHPVSVGECTS